MFNIVKNREKRPFFISVYVKVVKVFAQTYYFGSKLFINQPCV